MEAVSAGLLYPRGNFVKYLAPTINISFFRIKKVAWNCDFFDRSKREHLMKLKELCEGKHECDFIVNHETFGPDFRRCSHKAESEYSLELVYSCPGRSRDHNKIEKNQYTCVIPTTTTTTTTTMMMGHND